MTKILLKFLLLFGGITLGVIILGQIDFRGLTQAEEFVDIQEEKLGEILLKVFESESRKVTDSEKREAVDLITRRICESNELDCSDLKVHLFKNGMVNAFALPGGNVVVYSDLIAECENAEELAGVIAHEIAHIKLDHIRRKIMREIGVSMVSSIVGGTAGGEVARQTATVIANTSYGRRMEFEADEKAVEYLANAGINPIGLADLLQRVTSGHEELPSGFYWFSTHPNPEDRIRTIREKVWSGENFDHEPLYSEEEWKAYIELVHH
jgi:beta-barrel assembly-enhancing protease